MASPRTVSDEFNDRNYQKKSVSWGAGRRDDSIRKIVTEERKTVEVATKNPNSRFSTNNSNSRQTIDEAFNDEYSKKGIQPESFRVKKTDSGNRSLQDSKDQSLNSAQARGVLKNNQANRKRILASEALNKEKKLKAKMRITRLNLTIMSVGMGLWLSIQIPFAIFNLIFFGLASAMYEIERQLTVSGEGDGYFVAFGKSVARNALNLAKGAINLINDLTGIDLSLLHPANFFLLTYIFIIGFFVIFQLFVIYLIYKLAHLNPLSGDGAGFKIGTLILCVVGYSIPLLNLFPWFMVWVGAVWLKPK